MKRTQIYIREDQAERILERAEERGISQAELIRHRDAALDDARAIATGGIDSMPPPYRCILPNHVLDGLPDDRAAGAASRRCSRAR